MKENIRFFTHETSAVDNRKFLILRTYYGGALGWAMEARFWALNCLIGQADRCRLDTTQKGEKARIARALDLSATELEAFIVVLRDEAELVHDDGGILWTTQTQEDLARALASREGAKARRNGKQKKEPGDDPKTSGDDPKTSGEENHGLEQPGLDDTKEQLPPREGELSTGEEEPLSEDEARDFESWAIEKARGIPGVMWPSQYAQKILGDPGRLKEFRASRPRSPPPSYPDPGECAACGGDLMRYPGQAREERRCMRCGAEYRYAEVDGWTALAAAQRREEVTTP